jgi:hypothetical protein
MTLVFEKNANFFAENWQKSQKIVIITSTPGHPGSNLVPLVMSHAQKNRPSTAVLCSPTTTTKSAAVFQWTQCAAVSTYRLAMRLPPQNGLERPSRRSATWGRFHETV